MYEKYAYMHVYEHLCLSICLDINVLHMGEELKGELLRGSNLIFQEIVFTI
jgi:hypothetical protein